MKKSILIQVFIFVCAISTYAQITVATNNNVGIGVTSPVSKLTVGGTGETLSTFYAENSSTTGSSRAAKFYKSNSGTSGSPFSFAVVSRIDLNTGGSKQVSGYFSSYNSTPLSTDRAYGIYTLAGNATNGFNYGIWARVAGTNNGAAVYATTGSDSEVLIDDQYAGYFRGNVLIDDNLILNGTIDYTSDIKLKKEIRKLANEEEKQVDKLLQISAIKYKYKTPAELDDFDKTILDTAKVDPRTITYTDEKYTKDQIGLSAQEVQDVFPELVKEGSNGYLRMNYVGLIPVLVEAIKEQEAEIELLRKEIEKLKKVDTSN